MSRGNLSAPVLRELILSALPAESTEDGPPPPAHQVFVPKSHARALNLNIPVVIGDRGAGKSFWWTALQSGDLRALVEHFAPDTRIRGSTRVVPGFGKSIDLDRYPSRDVLASLRKEHRSARQIWKAVVVWAVGSAANEQPITEESPKTVELPKAANWTEKVAWLVDNPETADRLLQSQDEKMQAGDRDLLVVFDALDSAADDWDSLYKLVEGLGQVALELRSFRRLRAKVFLRTDQFDEHRVGSFPDASKLRASTATLHWLTTELFALLWQLLGNHPLLGGDYRQYLYTTLYERRLKERGLSRAEQEEMLRLSHAADWKLPNEAQFDAGTQELLFHRITGDFMGEDARKGFPYNWLPTHLADAHGEISPRSFLMALRTAVENTKDHYPNHEFAIHYLSLHLGIQEASRIRVAEIKEHRWVQPVLSPLAGGVLVPFDFADVAAIWQAQGTLEKLRTEHGDGGRGQLLPPRLNEGAAGVREDLMQLGILRQMRTGRIDVPDIYRLGFGLARKGGVPLLKSGREDNEGDIHWRHRGFGG